MSGMENMLERAAWVAAQTDVRGPQDPCRLVSWLTALFEDDYPSSEERAAAALRAERVCYYIARAVIASLRDPTEDVVGAGANVATDFLDGADGWSMGESIARRAYRAMIDKILES